MNPKRKAIALLLALAMEGIAVPSEAATYEQRTWNNKLYYRGSFEAVQALTCTLSVAAVDSYEVYLNGALVGADSLWTRMQTLAVPVKKGKNHLAAKVVNHGLGVGNGVMLSLAADTLILAETTTDKSWMPWFWTEVDQEGTAWTTAEVDKNADWHPVQRGSIARSQVTGLRDSDLEIIAGFPGGTDLGKMAGSIVLKEISGENLALNRSASRIEVVDGDLNTAWEPPVNALNFSVSIDLQARRNVDKVRVITKGKNEGEWRANSLKGYSIQLSDDQIRWSEVAVIHDIADFAKTEVEFRPTWTRYLRLVIVEINAITQPRVAEIEVYGSSFADRGVYLSPPLDFGMPAAPKNFGRVVWDAEVPKRTELTVQFRTGNGLADFADPEKGWSAPASVGGFTYPAEEPGRLLQYRVNMSTRDDTRSPVFKSIQIDYDTEDIPVSRAFGWVWPNRQPMGQDTTFSYTLDLDFETSDRGVERLRLDVPSQARLKEVLGTSETRVTTWHSTQQALEIAFAEPLHQDVQLEIRFQARTYAAIHSFRAYLFAPGSDQPLNVAPKVGNDPQTGMPYSWSLFATTSPKRALSQVRVTPPIFTPNGDGINDYAVIEFILAKVSTPRPVRLQIFDLRGQPVRDLLPPPLAAGTYLRLSESELGMEPGRWDGRDDQGNRVPPGIYLYRLAVDLDTGDEVETGVVGVAY